VVKNDLTAQEVADELGISLPTVYAYVSRGLLRSEATSTRRRRYRREDVERLKQRQEQRHHPERAAESALHWGVPILESGLTLIADGRLYYRGIDAVQLAQSHSFEQVAALLWTGNPVAELNGLYEPMTMSPQCQSVLNQLPDATLFERFQTLLPLAALDDPGAYDLRGANVIQTGARILRFLTAVAANQPLGEASTAETLQQAWQPDNPQAAALMNMALVLCADHELNVSSFTARCVASAGSTPYAVVTAGLAALQGAKHGGSTERVAALLNEIGTPKHARAALINRIKRGEAFPGFGHVLYTDGDPRGRLLLNSVAERYSQTEAAQLGQAVIEQVGELTGQQPNIDMALVILSRALGLPVGSPLALFALGRTVGWIGHALEQYQVDQLIRPRARYTGAPPSA
jgi:citrate synthase